MKKAFISFFSLSRLERTGFIICLSLLFVLLLAWRCMQYFIAPTLPDAEEQRLLARWETVRRQETSEPAVPPGNATVPAALFVFDPNTIDSMGMLRLGLAPRVAKGWLNWRRHGKKFYRPEDLKPLYNLRPEEYVRLAPYISIGIADPHQAPAFSNRYERTPLPATIDLNTADSALLVRLNGIGPVLAHKIIGQRKRLGGYLKHEQLLELYPFPDSTFAMLKEKLVIRPEEVRKIPINSVGLEELQRHPYIGEKMARNILLYREGLKRFGQVEQLRQVPLMNEENYRRIAPYILID